MSDIAIDPEPARPAGLARFLLGAFAAVGVINVAGLVLDLTVVANTTKPLLMPLLFGFVLATGAAGLPSMRLLLVGQVFAWFGDLALMSDAPIWFVTGMVMFLVMQICYIVGYFKLGARAGYARRRWVVFVFPVFWLIANAALWPGLGPLRLPIAVYSAALVTQAMTAVALGSRIGIGGTIFMCSDLMIGVTAAYGAFPGSRPLIMFTYLVGQGLIATAWIAIARSSARATGEQTAATP